MDFKKVLGFAIGPLGAAILSFISIPLITWFYSVEDIGKISMLQVFASFSVLIFSLGLDQSYIREYHSAKSRPELLKQTLMPGLILISLACGLVYFIAPDLLTKTLYDISDKRLAIITITCFIMTFFSRFLSLIVRMEERAIAYSMSQLLPKFFFLGFVFLSAWIGTSQDIYNLIFAHTLSIASVFFIFAWNTRQEWIKSISEKINLQVVHKLLLFGLPLMIGGLASWGLKVADRLFLRGLSTFTELGIYSVAMSIAGIATIFSGIFNTIWAPIVYKWANDGEDLSKIDAISEHLLASLYFITVLSGIFTWILPHLLPPEYYAVKYLVTVCLIGPMFYTLSETTAVGITLSRKTKLSMLASILAMLVNILGNYLLIPLEGAAGAAISTAFSFWLYYILRTEFSKLVWRKIPTRKSYLITTLLLIIVIINTLFLSNNTVSVCVWLLILFLGILIFKSSILSWINLVRSFKNKKTTTCI